MYMNELREKKVYMNCGKKKKTISVDYLYSEYVYIYKYVMETNTKPQIAARFGF